MNSNMSQQNWIEWHMDWSHSIDNETSDKHNIPIEEREIVKTDKGRIYPYYNIEMTTPKAKFFVTDLTRGKRGFWVPNAAIIDDQYNEVEVANWCELNEINFT